MMVTISKQEADIGDSIARTDKQLAEVNTKLGTLRRPYRSIKTASCHLRAAIAVCRQGKKGGEG